MTTYEALALGVVIGFFLGMMLEAHMNMHKSKD